MGKIKNILLRLKTRKLTTFFVMFGFIVAMLMVSFNISFTWALREEENILEKLGPPNNYIFYFTSKGSEHIPKEDITATLEEQLDNYTGAYLTDFYMNLDKAEVTEYFQTSAEWFGKESRWRYPLLEGRYYTRKEMLEGKNVALIGKNLKKYMNDDGKTIDIQGESYEVLGIVGVANQPLEWDMYLFLPILSLPEMGEKQFHSDGGQIIVYSSKKDILKQIDKFIDAGKKKWIKFETSEPEALQKRKISLIDLDSDFFLITIIVYIAAISQAMAIMGFWIDSMRFEIGIRKAIGHTDLQIGKLIYSEIFTITLLSYVFSIIIQAIINLFVKMASGVLITLRVENLTIGLIIIIFTSLITSVYPILKSLKVQPTEAMKL